jgi:hypothetical protein
MINLLLEIAIIVALTLLNGLFAMSETALVSSRKERLRQRADASDRGACTALELADEPTRFLSTVQDSHARATVRRRREREGASWRGFVDCITATVLMPLEIEEAP